MRGRPAAHEPEFPAGERALLFAFEQAGLAMKEARLLVYLMHHPAPIKVFDLAEEVGIGRGEASRYLRRRRSEDDHAPGGRLHSLGLVRRSIESRRPGEGGPPRVYVSLAVRPSDVTRVLATWREGVRGRQCEGDLAALARAEHEVERFHAAVVGVRDSIADPSMNDANCSHRP